MNGQASYRKAEWLVLGNSQAGGGQLAKEWDKWKRRLRELLESPPTFVLTQDVSEVPAAMVTAAEMGIRHVLALGGDGTAHVVANAVLRVQAQIGEPIVFALLPLGTGNDWVKTHGIPRQWGTWQAYFKTGIIQQQNVGLVTYQHNEETHERYFINVAGLAYDAFVVRYLANRTPRFSPKLFYLWATLRCLFQYRTQQARLRYADKTVEQRYYTINVGIGRYSGGGMQLVPQADPQGDTMALTYVGHVSILDVLLNSFRFYNGWIADFRKANLGFTSDICIEEMMDGPIQIEADGEYLGESPVRITMVPKALHFVGLGTLTKL